MIFLLKQFCNFSDLKSTGSKVNESNTSDTLRSRMDIGCWACRFEEAYPHWLASKVFFDADELPFFV